MKNIWNKAAAGVLLSGVVLLASCEKNDKGSLEGAVPKSSFTSVVNTTEFPVVVSFTSTSTDAFLYQWNFGDGSSGTGTSPKHTYNRGGTYKVVLTTAGRGGSNVAAPITVVVPDACDNATFSKTFDCAGGGTRVWAFSSEPGAIVKQNTANVVLSTSATLNSCQLDDQFTFSNSYTITYNAAGKTFQNGACGTALDNSSGFVFRPNASGNPQIVLTGKKAFIGTPDSVSNKTYDILEATDTKLRLRGANPDGTFTVFTLVPYNSTAPIKQLLTGGSSKTWLLNNDVDAAIVVGIESNPSAYYAGGKAGSLPACQTDDEYTFSSANVFTYDAKAETLSAAKGYSCSAPESGTSPFIFGPASGTGLAQFTLTRAGAFIGATDASPTERVYRVISIDDKKMTLRAGSGSGGGTVFDIKLVAK